MVRLFFIYTLRCVLQVKDNKYLVFNAKTKKYEIFYNLRCIASESSMNKYIRFKWNILIGGNTGCL